MLRRLIFAVALSGACSIAGVAVAFDQGEGGYFQNGNRLLEWCESSESLALAYVTGAYDAAQYMSVFVGSEAYAPTICTPAGSQNTQYRDIVCRYVDDHPEARTSSATSLVVMALQEAWPCP